MVILTRDTGIDGDHYAAGSPYSGGHEKALVLMGKAVFAPDQVEQPVVATESGQTPDVTPEDELSEQGSHPKRRGRPRRG